MAAAPQAGGIAPAQLGFLAIFNPSLGNTDETVDDQIVYYASVSTQADAGKRRRTRGRPTANLSQEERNERLRQIGLAQGMADFSRGFSDGSPADTIETEKSRVILHELEPGWWILASIDLTKVPLPPRLPTKASDGQEDQFEYSSREMKPACLLLSDLLRAHRIFLLHHDSSLSALFVRTRRSKFINLLSRYWDLYLSTWNVMLHGNPARSVYGGINIAASGQLGIGVGEEDRGSGEREVLEGLVGRIEGLVDLVVSKFGEPDPNEDSHQEPKVDEEPWLGTGRESGPDDGAIFLGTGALSTKSVRDIVHWTEDLYTWGEHAYGVIDSPTSVRRGKPKFSAKHDKPDVNGAPQPQIQDSTATGQDSPQRAEAEGQENQGADDGKLDKMVSYLKLGYGSYWTLPGTGQSTGESSTDASDAPRGPVPSEPAPARPALTTRTSSFEASGHYLIGLKGEIEDGTSDQDIDDPEDPDLEHNARTVLRTVNVELESEGKDRPEATIVKDFEHPASILTQSQVMGNMMRGYDSHDLNKAKKLRVVVYVNRPYIFTFLFQLRTDSLAWNSLYRSLHYQLAPLRKPLLASTTYRPPRPKAGGSAASSIYDLVWDPDVLTVHSSIPNIPSHYADEEYAPWSRADALGTHLHLLNMYTATRRSKAIEFERTQKSNRGWWIVWTRLLNGGETADDVGSSSLSTINESGAAAPSAAGSSRNGSREDLADDSDVVDGKEILLIRRASDHAGFRTGIEGDSLGLDTRRYVEELLSVF